MNHSSPLPRERTFDGAIRIFLAEMLLLPTGLLLAAFLTRRLGPHDYGLLILTLSFIGWLEWSIASLFARVTNKLVGESTEWKPVATRIIRLNAICGVGAAVLVYFTAGPLAVLWNEPALAGYLRLYALDIPLFCLAQAHRNILVGLGDFRQRALAGAARWISRLLLVVLLMEFGFSIEGAILGNIGASLIELLIARTKARPGIRRNAETVKGELWKYAVPLFLYAISMRLFDKLDFFMLKTMGGTAEQAGLYGAAQSLSLLPNIFALSFSPIVIARLSRLIRDTDSIKAEELIANATRAVVLFLPFLSLLAGAAPQIVIMIFGIPFLPSAQLLSVLLFSAVAVTMISVTTAILTASGKPAWTFFLTAPLAPVAALGHWFFIPRWGPIGASAVTLAVAALGALATTAAVYRIWRIAPPAKTILCIAILSPCMFAVGTFFSSHPFWLLLQLLVIMLLILVSFILFGEISSQELSRASSLLGTLRSKPVREMRNNDGKSMAVRLNHHSNV